MSQRNSHGTIQFSVELALAPHQTALAQHRQLNAIAGQLLDRFEAAGIGASWAVAPDMEAACSSILAAPANHEIAVLGDASWLGPQASARDSAEHLDRCWQAAESRGVPLTSVILQEPALTIPWELLATHQLQVVRDAVPAVGDMALSAKPRLARHGVCLVSVTGVWPVTSHWLGRLASGPRERQWVRRLARRGGSAHIALRAHQLLSATSRAWSALDGLLGDVARFVEQDVVRTETLAQMYQRRQQSLRGTPSRSVLRPAA